VCESLGVFLNDHASFDSVYTIKKLILDDNCIYVDKTQQIYSLVSSRGKYFLSRPRRFGKSTLISTFYEIFRGRCELFKDLWIYNSDYKWVEYPIIRMDFNEAKTTDVEYHIKDSLQITSVNYGIELDLNMPYDTLFKHLIIALHKKYQRQVVVLIDEYDKPILDVIEDVELAEAKRDILKGFYGVMKGADEYLHFVFLTGVTRFSKVGVFSGLNNLDDISMVEKYATLCGITQAELE
jgi:ABC-type long-subunit fatty acid transport system fused permease/ATPase subunit